ncbi:MAG: phosphoribosylanthranilate isomerase [Fimbriimonadaceae bacterium]|nr:phosphoribosylanthranilate isomerase [Alphaproteobacteria bacterium]
MASGTTKIKICGLSGMVPVEAAICAGADYLGFVFFEPSPRHISYDQAITLNARVAGRAKKVALTVDADDRRLDDIVASLDPDVLQLHGDESPQRVREVSAQTGLPVIKAIKIRGKDDLGSIDTYQDVADMLLFDARMPDNAVDALPGGNGVAFDWSLLGETAKRKPFMLSGGLSCENVARAISSTRPAIVDVSSGVERKPGEKDVEKIRRFIEEVKRADKQDHAA